MKKITKSLILIFAIVVFSTLLTLCAFAETYTGECGNNVTYSVNTATGVLTVTGYGETESYAIYAPAPFNEYKDYIRTAIVSEGIDSLGQYFFYGCDKMVSVSLPESLTYIASYVFDECSALKSVDIPLNVYSIDSWSFRGCSSLSSFNVDPFNEFFCDIDGVLFTKDEATLVCYPGGGKAQYTIPDSVSSIESYAFYSCATIEKVTVSSNVDSIGSRAFSYCPKLTKIYVDSDNEFYCDLSGVLFSKDKKTLFVYPSGAGSSYTVPSGTKTVEEFAFYSCENLTSITVCEGVTTLRSFAFDSCTNLTDLILPDSLTNIEDNVLTGTAFWFDKTNWEDDNVLYVGNHLIDVKSTSEEFTVRDGTLTIATSALSSCYDLTSVKIPNSVKSICERAFYYCISLENVDIPEGVTYIGNSAFSKCTSLQSITLPDSVTYLDYSVFDGCSNLSRVSFGKNLNYIGHNILKNTAYYNNSANWDLEAVLYVGEYLIEAKETVANTYISKGDVKLIANYAFKDCTDLTKLVINGSTVSIGNWAFSGCKNLKSINIPATVNYIGNYAFDDCHSLESIYIPSNVTYIGDSAFSSCYSITSITIPDSVTYLGSRAFSICDMLENVTLGNGITAINNSTFSNCEKLKSIIIPSSVTKIDDFAFNGCTNLTSVTIGKNVKTIGFDAFSFCFNLEKVTFGNSLKKIDDMAFFYCERLDDIKLPDSLTYIGRSAFENCASLTSVTIPDNVTEINDFAFCYCQNLEKISLGSKLTSIGDSSFYNCIALQEIKIPSSVKVIESNAFSGCYELRSVTLPSALTTIGSYAFSDCSALTGITFGSALKTIEGGAFYNCTAIKNIKFPKSVTHIGDMSFAYCYELESATFNNISSEIADDAFYDCQNLNTIYLYRDSTADLLFSDDEYTKVYFDEDTSEANKNFEFKVNEDNVSVTITKYIGNGGEVIIPSKIDGKNVTVVGYGAFEWLPVDVTSVVIPNTVKTIRTYAFHDCRALESVTIPNSVTKIEASAFALCPMLQNVTIPASVSVIENSVFMGCTSLKAINVDKDNSTYCDIDGVLFSKDKSKLISYPANGNKNYVIPEGVRSIDVTAFVSCDDLISISVPRSISQIGENSFAYCDSLEKIFLFKDSCADEFFTNSIYAECIEYFSEYKSGDVMVDAKSDNGFEEGAELVSENIPEAELGDFVISNTHGKNPDLVAYDIKFEMNGVETQPNSFVTVRIKVPNNFNGKRCKVYHYTSDGSLTDMEAEYVDGYMVFQTDHFSVYIVADIPASTSGDVNGDGTVNTKDAVLLAQYLSNWAVTVDNNAADCNKDGSVTIKDMVLLAQYLAGWNVTLQ